jgi:HEAT repeat protein
MNTKNKQNAIAPIIIAVLITSALTAFSPREARAADEATDMIVELITGSDDDMRLMAIQQVSEAAPGKDATKRFVALLPKLKPDMQAKMIDALGTRGDATARPAILAMLTSKTPAIRVAAAGALAAMASPDDVPALAKQAAAGSEAEQDAARQCLRKLKGEKMNAAMIKAMKDADPKTKIELINALTDRNVTSASPTIAKGLGDSEQTVRTATLKSLSAMGDETHTTALVKHMKAAKDPKERRRTALTLLAVCRRGKAKCAPAVIAGMKGTDASTCILLMRILTEAGGPEALTEVVARMKDDDKNISATALRTLTGWPDRDAVPHLKTMAGDVTNLRNHILSIRALVRLASANKDRPADLTGLTEAMKLASRTEEKTLILGAMSAIATPEALTITAACLDKPELVEPAAQAAVTISEKIIKTNKAQVQTVLQKILQKIIKTAKNETTLTRAKRLLD